MALRFRLRTLLVAVAVVPFLILATIHLLDMAFYSQWIGWYALKLTFCHDLSHDRQLQRLEFYECIDSREAEKVKAECIRAHSEGRRPLLPLDVAMVSDNDAVLQIRSWGKVGLVTGRELKDGAAQWIVLKLHWDDESVEHYIVELPERSVRGSREERLSVRANGSVILSAE